MKLSFQQIAERVCFAAGAGTWIYEFVIGPAVFQEQPKLQLVALGFGALAAPFAWKKDTK
jgi:hypothetical protein